MEINVNNNNNYINYQDIDFSMDMEVERFKQLHHFLYYIKEEDNDDTINALYRKEIPYINLELKSPIIHYERQYLKSIGQNVDPYLENIQYPKDVTDEQGNLKFGILTSADFVIKILLETSFITEQKNRNIFDNTTARILAKDKMVRTTRLAWSLTARKHMMNIKNSTDQLIWSPFELDVEMYYAAKKMVDMADIYSVLLALVNEKNTNNNKKIYKDNFDKKFQTENIKKTYQIKKIILKELIRTTVPPNYTTDTSEFCKIVERKKGTDLKGWKNLQHIELVLDELESFGLVYLKKGAKRHTKYFRIITRKGLSESIEPKNRSSVIKYFDKYGIELRIWAQAFGTNEVFLVNKWI